MRYLLDTNALIGMLFNPEFLSKIAKETIENCDELYFSIISLWEIGIKQANGKIGISMDAEGIKEA